MSRTPETPLVIGEEYYTSCWRSLGDPLDEHSRVESRLLASRVCPSFMRTSDAQRSVAVDSRSGQSFRNANAEVLERARSQIFQENRKFHVRGSFGDRRFFFRIINSTIFDKTMPKDSSCGNVRRRFWLVLVCDASLGFRRMSKLPRNRRNDRRVKLFAAINFQVDIIIGDSRSRVHVVTG